MEYDNIEYSETSVNRGHNDLSLSPKSNGSFREKLECNFREETRATGR